MHFRFQPNLWVCADILGYPVPENLFQCLENLNNAFGLIYKGGSYDEPNLIIAHFNDASNERQSTNSCIKYFSSQRNDMDVWCPASVVSPIAISSHCIKYGSIRENTGQWKSVFSHISCSEWYVFIRFFFQNVFAG